MSFNTAGTALAVAVSATVNKAKNVRQSKAVGIFEGPWFSDIVFGLERPK
jgi:hypothetical protein